MAWAGVPGGRSITHPDVEETREREETTQAVVCIEAETRVRDGCPATALFPLCSCLTDGGSRISLSLP